MRLLFFCHLSHPTLDRFLDNECLVPKTCGDLCLFVLALYASDYFVFVCDSLWFILCAFVVILWEFFFYFIYFLCRREECIDLKHANIMTCYNNFLRNDINPYLFT